MSHGFMKDVENYFTEENKPIPIVTGSKDGKEDGANRIFTECLRVEEARKIQVSMWILKFRLD
jgi:hypothetical protein